VTTQTLFTIGHSNRTLDEFIDLMVKRAICLLCSEHLPKHCHRRLFVEYPAKHWGEIRTEQLT